LKAFNRALVPWVGVALASMACNAILGIGSTTYEAKKDATAGDASTRDAGEDVARDARDVARDALVDRATDAGRDTGLDGGHDAADAMSDVMMVCPPPDARPEGGRRPDPGFVECNSVLPKYDGGNCNVDAGYFCCNPATAEAGVAGGTCTESTTPNVASCTTMKAPVFCDEAADCPKGDDCCGYLDELTLTQPDPQYQQLCQAPVNGQHCVSPPMFPELHIQICKTNAECGPCGTCSVYCCVSTQVETCANPYPMYCKPELCKPTNADAFQNDSETDIDCGGAYLTDAEANPVSDHAPPCGPGHTCKIGRDCKSHQCVDAGGGALVCK
jgi:hypothetical protein